MDLLIIIFGCEYNVLKTSPWVLTDDAGFEMDFDEERPQTVLLCLPSSSSHLPVYLSRTTPSLHI